MDDSPKNFVHEFRSAILKKRVGQIALAIVLAEACILNSLLWYAVVPAIAWILQGHTESVMFRDHLVFPWERLFGSLLEFLLALIFVFYANRWIRGSAGKAEAETPVSEDEPDYYNIAGEPVSPTEQGMLPTTRELSDTQPASNK